MDLNEEKLREMHLTPDERPFVRVGPKLKFNRNRSDSPPIPNFPDEPKHDSVKHEERFEDAVSSHKNDSDNDSVQPDEKFVEALDPNDIIPDEEQLLKLQENLSDEEVKERTDKADELKKQANELYKAAKYEDALNVYTEAITTAPAVNKKQRAILFANRAACKVQLNFRKAAIEDCSHAIALDDKYVRALNR